MTLAKLHNGSEIATGDRSTSQNFANPSVALRTLDDLARELKCRPPQNIPKKELDLMLTICPHLTHFLGKPMDELPLVEILEFRRDFRAFLKERTFSSHTLSTYVASLTRLFNYAKKLGWDPAESLPRPWQGVFRQAQDARVESLVLHLSRIRRSPKEVTEFDTDQWLISMVAKGRCWQHFRKAKTLFWRLLRDAELVSELPAFFKRESKYSIPLESFPPGLQKEVKDLLDWRQATFSAGRPNGKVRPRTALGQQKFLSSLYGYAVNILRRSDIQSIPQLADRQLLESYAEFYINKRGCKGTSVISNVGSFFAALRYYPPFKKSVDQTWFSEYLNHIPTEGDQESLEACKSVHYLAYDQVSAIPDEYRPQRLLAEKNRKGNPAVMAMEELLLRFLCTLVWRNINLRECRIDGAKPNLFKGPIPHNPPITKPVWVTVEEKQHPGAEFWQFQFFNREVKTCIHIHSILPRQLIAPLEEYLRVYRPQLVGDYDPGTLFVKSNGSALTLQDVDNKVETLTARYRGVRVNPHHFRDIFAYAWLDKNPDDYLTLSKMLWHRNITTTLNKYGKRYNESSAVCKTETWLELLAAARGDG